MKLLLVALTLASGLLFNAFRTTEDKKVYEYTILSTIQTMGSNGMIGTDSTGKLEKTKLKPFHGFGIDIEWIGENDQLVAAKLNEYGKAGWELTEIAPTATYVKYIFKREKR